MATLAVPTTAEQTWAELMRGNCRFVNGTPQPRDLIRERQAVARSQYPKAIVLACADSRVAPEIIFDQRLGDLFVVRVAGCVADKQAIGSLEYAAEHLGPSILVVIGHQHCAAVRAACSGRKVSSPNLKAIIAAIQNSRTSTDIVTEDGMAQEVVKENVRYVARALLDRSELLHRQVQRGDLTVITAFYRLDTGEVEQL